MTVFRVAYHSISFIICLFMISRIILIKSLLKYDRQQIKKTFMTMCLYFIIWAIAVVSVGVSQWHVIDVIFLLIAEFMRICTFVSTAELCAVLTDKAIGKKKSIYVISSELLYFGTTALAIRVIQNRAATVEGYFGTNFDMPLNIGFLINVFFNIVVIFFCGIYTYMHFYSMNTKRENYISKRCAVIVGIFVVALTVETVCYVQFKIFVPSMFVGTIISIAMFRDLILYKRSIEYDESDYDATLNPAQEKPAFVCDDRGVVLFENTRAFVMRQTYKDEYIGKPVTEIFEITDYDKERLKDPRLTQKFEVYCKYAKDSREMLLIVKHNLDKFGDIFTTEILIGYADSAMDSIPVVASNSSDDTTKKQFIDLNLTYEKIVDIRTKELIKQLDLQKKLYEKADKTMFEINLKGIEKAASVLGLSALEELCGRMQTELVFGEWDGLNPMMIDLDRQYETLSFMNN